MDREHLKIPDHHGHVDHENPHTFEIEDLKKLIHKTSEDLAEADRKRRDEFKVNKLFHIHFSILTNSKIKFCKFKSIHSYQEYEMQKEFEKQEKLREMDEEHKKKYEEDIKLQQQKHNTHERVHHPGNKAQLEEGEYEVMIISIKQLK